MTARRVRAGDCMSSIAFETGFFWETLWEHPDNAELKAARSSPFTLVEGDRVAVPAKTPKQVDATLDQRHRFRRRGVPAKLVVRLLDAEGQPRSGEHFVLEVDGELIGDGQTDGGGFVRQFVSPNAKRARLFIGDGAEVYEVTLGRLEPADTVRGLQARLKNLGFYSGAIDGEESPLLAHAVERFCAERGLPSGASAEAIRAALVALHDG